MACCDAGSLWCSFGRGPGRKSASAKRSAAFIEQFASKYEAIREAKRCHGSPDKIGELYRSNAAALAAQQEVQARRKAQEENLDMRSEESGDDSDVRCPPKQVAGEAIERWMEIKSPAAYAMERLQQRLPAPQVGGGYAIPSDQYDAVILAVAPLQSLWLAAGEAGLRHAFGRADELGALLPLVKSVPWMTM